ncbi:Parallel beta-helix repeat protein [Candidatus Koribacter versatilis Ellin345]|uniref:Parallel beta-helix repeat protein n=1 Tax=Koribacter versatilis (strain Ellin345) TaxID=204669 RepID=Q1ITY3_KORVE|nr:choice-of-anchor Q domain-containing protein [Candidatus Koribacter versatilis]ABF39667.1 Parallel beta-helix repeat protein [Candidatus Koribacter versatilis Ellin345]
MKNDYTSSVIRMLVAAIGFCGLAFAQSNTTFYVATNGNDSNAGTIGAPWKTIQHAANSVQAGATVDVRAGTYNESVNIPVSGNATAGYVTFQGYPGETAIVDGTGLSCCGGSTKALFNITNQSYVIVSSFEIRNYSTSAAASTPAGIFVTGGGSNIQLLNNKVHDIASKAENNGNAFGIAVYGTSSTPISNIVISGNQVYNCKTGNSETVNVDGNVNGFTISNNIVHDDDNIGIDAIGFEGVGPSGSDQARNGTISGNTIYNITSYGNPAYGNQYAADGIYCDGCTNVVIERNLVRTTDLNIEVASEHKNKTSSYVTVRNNLVYNANSCGISIGGYASGVGGSDHITIVGNTLFNNDTKKTGSGEFQIQYHATNNIFENNIVSAGPQGLMVNNFTKSVTNPVTSDYNVFYASTPANATWIWYAKTYATWAKYLSASGQDAHSFYANPLFVNTATPDLHVQASSPAVNSGTNLGVSVVGTKDFAGNPRVQGTNIDIGAYEQ